MNTFATFSTCSLYFLNVIPIHSWFTSFFDIKASLSGKVSKVWLKASRTVIGRIETELSHEERSSFTGFFTSVTRNSMESRTFWTVLKWSLIVNKRVATFPDDERRLKQFRSICFYFDMQIRLASICMQSECSTPPQSLIRNFKKQNSLKALDSRVINLIFKPTWKHKKPRKKSKVLKSFKWFLNFYFSSQCA